MAVLQKPPVNAEKRTDRLTIRGVRPTGKQNNRKTVIEAISKRLPTNHRVSKSDIPITI